MYIKYSQSVAMLFIISVFSLTYSAVRAEQKPKPRFEDDSIMFRIVYRTPESISAFYQGREFNQQAINEILKTCYVTAIIKNKSQKTLWLELDNWQFFQQGKEIRRIKRDYWKKYWQIVKLKKAHQATFGWTLMPESRDLRFDEGVGGSVVIPMTQNPFTLTASFHTQQDKNGPIKTITLNNVECKQNDK